MGLEVGPGDEGGVELLGLDETLAVDAVGVGGFKGDVGLGFLADREGAGASDSQKGRQDGERGELHGVKKGGVFKKN